MLTADLLLFTRRKGRIRPTLLDPGDPLLLDGAEAMVQLAEAHLGKRRGDLEPLLRGFPFKGRPPKMAAGLARLLLEHCRFEVGGPDPDPMAPGGAGPGPMEPGGAGPGPMAPGGAAAAGNDLAPDQASRSDAANEPT